MVRRSREETAETRRRILGTASRLFRARGISPVSVADIMGDLGLTVGGFYRHFDSKDALVAEAIGTASDQTRVRFKTVDGSDAKRASTLLDGYLSKGHRDNPADGCPVAALCSEVAHEPEPTREAFTQATELLVEIIGNLIPGEAKEARDRRLCTLAAIVGGVVLSRATSDRALADDLLQAVRREVLGDQPPEARRARKSEAGQSVSTK